MLWFHITRQQRRPDWIHAHYADAGWVGAQIQQRLGIPLVFTGHSLAVRSSVVCWRSARTRSR